MSYTTLIQAAQLQTLLASTTPVVVFDCSFDLMAPSLGAEQYQQAHIPGARYADINQDLSAAADDQAASGGRHPLPSRQRFAAWLGKQGVANNTQVVVYDRNGVNYCGRLWWMLKWAGHDAVAVLDGGWHAWLAIDGASASGAQAAAAPGHFALQAPLRPLVSAEQVAQRLGQPGQTLLDARARPRYLGEVEPLDPVAGHIPGALNRPFGDNIAADGRFKPAALLRAEFEQLLQQHDPASLVHHCGSGVSAIPNLLAMEVAGYAPTALFAGSWSAWCADPSRPVARG